MKYYEKYNSEKNKNYLNATIKICHKYNCSFAVLNSDKYLNNEILRINDSIQLNRSFIGDNVIVECNNLNSIEEKFHYSNEAYVIIGSCRVVNNLSVNENKEKLYLTGILEIYSKISHGKNKKGMPIYTFKPLDRKYPNFHVPSNYKNKFSRKNVYAVIKYKNWDINEKQPSGICEKIIGHIGDVESEYECILHKYDLNYVNYKRKDLESVDKVCCIGKKERFDYTGYNCFSIDPDGCLDIDDAIHICCLKNEIEIGVHIADVSNYIHEDSVLDNIAFKRGSSVYCPHKTINMLPAILSENICSLKENEERFTFSVIFRFDRNYCLLDTEYKKGVIKSRSAMTYKQCQDLIDKRNNSELTNDLLMLKEVTNILATKFNIKTETQDEYEDAHKIIDTLMILTNKTVAEFIYNKDNENAILRVHEGINFQRNKFITDNSENLDKNLASFLKITSTKSAQYSNCKTNNFHFGLGIKTYTHFTSPIRRYVDIMNHRLLWNIITGKDNKLDTTKLDYLNSLNKRINKMERDINKIKVISTLADNEENITAYITQININDKIIQLYLDSLKISINYKLYSDKLDDLIKCESDIFSLKIIKGKSYLNLKLFQKLDLCIRPHMYSEKDKIIISVISPNINNFILVED